MIPFEATENWKQTSLTPPVHWSEDFCSPVPGGRMAWSSWPRDLWLFEACTCEILWKNLRLKDIWGEKNIGLFFHCSGIWVLDVGGSCLRKRRVLWRSRLSWFLLHDELPNPETDIKVFLSALDQLLLIALVSWLFGWKTRSGKKP